MPKNSTIKLLVHLAIFTFGIQFSNSLLLANLSGLYKFLGASNTIIPYLGMAAPMSGLIIQPLIGHLSDDTATRWGKRRPYLLFWSVFGIIACVSIAWIRSLFSAVILLWILGCSINGVTEALRALTGDLISTKDKTLAFSLQTIASGIGAAIAVSIPSIINKLFPRHIYLFNSVPLSIKVAFYFAALMWCVSIYWLWNKVHEKPLKHLTLYSNLHRKQPQNYFDQIKHFWRTFNRDVKQMPIIMRQFSIIQVFTWIGLYAMWLYFSIAISQHLYSLPLQQLKTDNSYVMILNTGVIQSNLYFGVYQFVSVIYAIALIGLSKCFKPLAIHGTSLCIGGLSLLILSLTHSTTITGFCMIGVGILWGSVMTMPYSIISSSLPANKMGVYLGIFNISITLPQILAAFILPTIYNDIFFHHAIAMMILSGSSLFIAGLFTLRLINNKSIFDMKFYYLMLFDKAKLQWKKIIINYSR